MSIINFIVTEAGRLAILDAQEKRLRLSLTTVGLGDGRYNPTGKESALVNQFTENGVSAGGIDSEMNLLRFTIIMNYGMERPVSEIGLFTDTGILFAVAASPSAAFFNLYPSIDYIATLGMSLNNVTSPESIELIVNGDAGLSTEIMQAHVLEANPHPQYLAYMDQVLEEHLEQINPHPQYALKTFVNDQVNIIEGKIDRLYQLTEYLFPPLLRAEFVSGPTLEMKRKLGVSYSFASRGMVALVCPENNHEAWSLNRQENAITVTAHSRSGTGRIGYTGRLNGLLIDTDRTLQREGFLAKTNQLAREIKSGVILASERFEINKTGSETLPYTSKDLVLLISPEGQHEGWTIERSDQKFTISIFNRSGTNRVGYTGNVSWMLLRANAVPLARDKYPFNLISGVSETGSFLIPAPSGMDFSQSNFMPIITPEGQHEGWTISRTNAGFQVEVFNRSGTNRVGYTGRVNWAVFMTSQSSLRTVFQAGTHRFTFKANSSYRITLVGGGGGGGNAVRYHSGATPLAADNGGDTVLNVSGLLVTAHGGEGGIRGCWNNGSAYRDGTSGLGGDVKYSNSNTQIQDLNVQSQKGEAGKMQQYNVGNGGAAAYGLEFSRGAGGKGKAGSGSRELGYGGSGGGAGSALVSFKVTGSKNIEANINVGAGGKYFDDPTEYYQSNWHFGYGEVGQAGIMIIEEYKD